MPSGTDFLPVLARVLTKHYGPSLYDALILLPTRRAVREMRMAFAEVAKEAGRGATLLPRMRPLADINPEEPPFEPGEIKGAVPPAMPKHQRRFEMAKLVTAYHRRAADLPLDPASALALADPLLSIMDDAAMEEVSITDSEEWSKIMADSALHFQHAATLYKIIETYWPARLAELGLMECQARKVKLLNLLTEHWLESPPDYPVIIAGSTGTLKATARLMACVASMPKGMIVLPGLQTTTDQNWESIDVQHPQWSMKNLLALLDLDREHVKDIRALSGGKPKLGTSDYRRTVVNEALVAVDKTSDWLRRIKKLEVDHGKDVFGKAMDGLSLLVAPNHEDEALSIAFIMREAVEEQRSAALITPDQGLARRVRMRLKRWAIDVPMSQGQPVSQMLIGQFIMAIMQLAKDPSGPLELSVLFNHPYTSLAMEKGEAKQLWQTLEKERFRGIRPHFDGELPELLTKLSYAMSPLTQIADTPRADVWAEALLTVAQNIADPSVWSDSGAREALSAIEDIIAYGSDLPVTSAEGIERLLHRMLGKTICRVESHQDNKLSILGPLEARLLTADTIVMGGLNEGIWPSAPSVDPFLSRKMREEMHLSLPERRYGLAAHDFAELVSNKKVFLTRSERNESGPTVASRWIWRLQVLLEGALGEKAAKALLATGDHYLGWAQTLDSVTKEDLIKIEPPNFAPPIDKRWAYYRGVKQSGSSGRRISITQVKNWIRDPYAIYAQRSLGLLKLDELDMPHDVRIYGTAIHEAIEDFIKQAKPRLNDDDREFLENAFERVFQKYGYAPEIIAHEKSRFHVMATELITWFQTRYELGYDLGKPEVYADYQIPEMNFRLTGQADLMQDGPEGLASFDFKTGPPSSAAEVAAGFDPQLPLASYLAQQGAFKAVSPRHTRQLGYVRVKGSNDGFAGTFINAPEISKGKEISVLTREAADTLKKLIQAYDDPSTAYASQPRVKYSNKYGDYDHLARRQEWRGLVEGNGEGET